MWCVTCNKVLENCTCNDREERMRQASNDPHFATKWCITCDKSYHFCKCSTPVFKMRVGGKIEELPEAYR